MSGNEGVACLVEHDFEKEENSNTKEKQNDSLNLIEHEYEQQTDSSNFKEISPTKLTPEEEKRLLAVTHDLNYLTILQQTIRNVNSKDYSKTSIFPSKGLSLHFAKLSPIRKRDIELEEELLGKAKTPIKQKPILSHSLDFDLKSSPKSSSINQNELQRSIERLKIRQKILEEKGNEEETPKKILSLTNSLTNSIDFSKSDSLNIKVNQTNNNDSLTSNKTNGNSNNTEARKIRTKSEEEEAFELKKKQIQNVIQTEKRKQRIEEKKSLMMQEKAEIAKRQREEQKRNKEQRKKEEEDLQNRKREKKQFKSYKLSTCSLPSSHINVGVKDKVMIEEIEEEFNESECTCNNNTFTFETLVERDISMKALYNSSSLREEIIEQHFSSLVREQKLLLNSIKDLKAQLSL
ncbi:hypothetical protein ABK040_014989 [Willaertia magna]